MTREQKDSMVSALMRIGPILIAVGIAWGSLVGAVRSRLSISRFEAESLRAVYWREKQDDRFTRIDEKLDKLLDRQSRMYCRGNPDPACQ